MRKKVRHVRFRYGALSVSGVVDSDTMSWFSVHQSTFLGKWINEGLSNLKWLSSTRLWHWLMHLMNNACQQANGSESFSTSTLELKFDFERMTVYYVTGNTTPTERNLKEPRQKVGWSNELISDTQVLGWAVMWYSLNVSKSQLQETLASWTRSIRSRVFLKNQNLSGCAFHCVSLPFCPSHNVSITKICLASAQSFKRCDGKRADFCRDRRVTQQLATLFWV